MPSGSRLPDEKREELPAPEDMYRPNRAERRNRRIKNHGQVPLAVIGKPGATYSAGKRWYKNAQHGR